MGCDGCELWNPAKGVKRCYAGVLHDRHGGRNTGYAPSFDQVTLFEGRMLEAVKAKDLLGRRRPEKPWLDGCRRMIFVSDMSDALSKAVSFEFLTREIIEHVRSTAGQRHVWLWLTKQPARMAEFARWLAKQGVDWPAHLCGRAQASRAVRASGGSGIC